MPIQKLLVIFLCMISMHAFSQKTLNEGTLKYNITIDASSDQSAIAKSFEGATLTLFLKGAQSRSDMVSSLGTETDLFDNKAGSGAILKQYSGQKLMITLTNNNWIQMNKVYQSLKFTIEPGEQMIAGYNCKKATGSSADGKTFVVYFTPDIVTSNKSYMNAFAQLPGLPVQYELQSGKLKFKYTLSSINYDPVPAAKFELPKTGFRVMTYDENQQMKNGK